MFGVVKHKAESWSGYTDEFEYYRISFNNNDAPLGMLLPSGTDVIALASISRRMRAVSHGVIMTVSVGQERFKVISFAHHIDSTSIDGNVSVREMSVQQHRVSQPKRPITCSDPYVDDRGIPSLRKFCRGAKNDLYMSKSRMSM
ncbi:hypothetical protein BJV82DRAFT_577326 [Fennellomyces sp. T-0311]|nr:hypothetical protein BJV82DRAFT_577326 [Fennellomyces sp. T-0311]